MARAYRQSIWKWLLHHYLFFRIPVARPDRFLSSAVQPTAFLFTRAFALLTLAALVPGVVLVYRQWDVFRSTLVDTFSPSGMFGYACALLFVKVLHELGHGIVARRSGCRVPAMGVAFMVLWPMPYTDVNEAWKLPDRRARLAIGAAGVLTELAVAAWMTLAWGLLPDGLLRDVAFLLATTTWISTLAVNLSPFMRFDGYFVLSDLLGIPNLHSRSFQLARWKLREWLFSLGEAPPEYFDRRKAAVLIAFAWFTWLYRLAVFVGIALLVYAFFIKLVGIILFIIEIAWFVAMPIQSELKIWKSRWPAIRESARSRRVLWVGAFFLAVLALPMPWPVQVSGLLHPGEEYLVFAREPGRLDNVLVTDGQHVTRDMPLFVLTSTSLEEKRQAAQARITRLTSQANAASVSPELQSRLLVLLAELDVAKAAYQNLESQLADFRIKSAAAGKIRLADPDLRKGIWVGRHERLATVITDDAWHVEAYVAESEIHRIAVGDRAKFYLDSGGVSPLPISVKSIDRDATRLLPSGVLGKQLGGSIAVREVEGRAIPESAVYRIRLESTERLDALAGQTWRGSVVLHSGWESILARALRAAFSVLWREAGW